MCIRVSDMLLSYLNGVVENNSHVHVFFIYLFVSNIVCLLFKLSLQVDLVVQF